MKKILLPIYLFLLLVVPSISFAQTASEKTVKEYMIELNMMAVQPEIIARLIDAYKELGVPEYKIIRIKKEINFGELTNRFIPVYQKHFTESELKEIIKFYRTPVGRKMADKNNAISKELEAISDQWAGETASVVDKIIAE